MTHTDRPLKTCGATLARKSRHAKRPTRRQESTGDAAKAAGGEPMRITVRKTTPPKGLARITHDRTQRHVCVDGEPIYRVAQRNEGEWFWYGDSHNTIWEKKTFATRDDAIEDIKQRIRQKEATR